MKDHIYKTRAIAAALLAALMIFTSYIPAKVFASSNIPVIVYNPVTYIVNGNAEIAGGDTVTLTADDPSSPMPGGTEGGKKTINIRNEGTYSFGDIRFDKPGVHWYTVTRNLTKRKGVTKDGTVYKAKVIALNDGHGYVLAYKEGSDEKSELVYEDKVAPATGDVSKVLGYLVILIASAVSLTALAVFRVFNKRRKVQNGYE